MDHAAATQIFHININCSDLNRSRVFYEALGFRVVNTFEAAGPDQRVRSFAEIGLAPMLDLPEDCDARAVLMALDEGPRVTRLDLIEWIRPRSEPAPPRNLARLGFGRLCLKVRDCNGLHEQLLNEGHTVLSPPILIDMGGTQQKCFCCEDPDGTVIEFMQFLR